MIKPAHVLNKMRKTWVRGALALSPRMTRIAADSAAARIARSCRVICEPEIPDALSVLNFSSFRFTEDLEVLASTGQLRLLEAPLDVLQSINGFFDTVPAGVKSDDYAYFLEQDPHHLAERKLQQRFYREVVKSLCRRLSVDCAMTPAVQHRFAFPWQAAFEAQRRPFIALHKEFTVLDRRQIPERVESYRRLGFRFNGSWIFVTNESARNLFTEAEIFAPERIVTTGLPRMDRLFRDDGPFRTKTSARRQVILFSFAHYCGGIGATRPRRSPTFSKYEDEGFVQLFREVHRAFGELALAHPDVEFKIKPREVAGHWVGEIDRVLQDSLGCTLDDIPNCSVVADSAPELIRDSDAVIGFNSTVLLESLALGRPTIVPIFAEAADRYWENIYLRDCLDVFLQAHSRDDIKAKVEGALEGRISPSEASEERLRQCFEFYLGYSDGRCAERVVEELRRVVALYRDGAAGQAAESLAMPSSSSRAA